MWTLYESRTKLRFRYVIVRSFYSIELIQFFSNWIKRTKYYASEPELSV